MNETISELFELDGFANQPARGIGLNEHGPNCVCGCRMMTAFNSETEAFQAKVRAGAAYRDQQRGNMFYSADGGRR